MRGFLKWLLGGTVSKRKPVSRTPMWNYEDNNAEKRIGLNTMPLILGEFLQSYQRRYRHPVESWGPEIQRNAELDSGLRRNDGSDMVPPGRDTPQQGLAA
jgi:hypothetical protein